MALQEKNAVSKSRAAGRIILLQQSLCKINCIATQLHCKGEERVQKNECGAGDNLVWIVSVNLHLQASRILECFK